LVEFEVDQLVNTISRSPFSRSEFAEVALVRLLLASLVQPEPLKIPQLIGPYGYALVTPFGVLILW
jgi:hypothetical protein